MQILAKKYNNQTGQAMQNISKYDLAFLGIRFLAVYTLIQAIGGIGTSAYYLSSLSAQYPTGIPLDIMLPMVLLPLAFIAIPFLLWLLSSKLASAISFTRSQTIMNDRNLKDLQTILFTSIGVFLFVTTVPTLLGITAAYIKYLSQHNNPISPFEPSSARVPDIIDFTLYSSRILLSMILMFSARNLSDFFKKLRNAGLE